jgi:hypothetical protein
MNFLLVNISMTTRSISSITARSAVLLTAVLATAATAALLTSAPAQAARYESVSPRCHKDDLPYRVLGFIPGVRGVFTRTPGVLNYQPTKPVRQNASPRFTLTHSFMRPH